MFKKIILLVAVVLASFSCKKNTNDGFKGKWVNIDDKSKVIVITKVGDYYSVNIDDTKKYPAIENKEILKIIIEKDTIKATIDKDHYLILNNQSFKKINGTYKNPGAGVY